MRLANQHACGSMQVITCVARVKGDIMGDIRELEVIVLVVLRHTNS